MDSTVHPRHPEARSLAGLVSDLWRETSQLLHAEAELAKAEIYEKMSQIGSSAAAIGGGGAIVFAGFIVVLFAAVEALALVLDPEYAAWLAPLIVGVAVMLIGFVVLATGRRRLKAEQLAPRRTLDTIRDDWRLAKAHVSRSTRDEL
jgi:hypothetical protein